MPILSLRLLSLPLLLLTACSIESRDTYLNESADPGIVRAESWSQLTLVVAGARTQLSSNGHFTTVPNACYRRENGVLDLALWNRVATAVNRMVQQPWHDEVTCPDRPAGSPDLYQPVVLQLRTGPSRDLLTSRGASFCTRSADLESAQDLLLALGEVAARARIEGCQPSSILLESDAQPDGG